MAAPAAAPPGAPAASAPQLATKFALATALLRKGAAAWRTRLQERSASGSVELSPGASHGLPVRFLLQGLYQYNRSKTIRSALRHLLFTGMLIFILYASYDVTAASESNLSLKNALMDEPLGDSTWDKSWGTGNVQTPDDFGSWLSSVAVPALYPPAGTEVVDYLQLVGGVRLRQLRVRNDSCAAENLAPHNCLAADTLPGWAQLSVQQQRELLETWPPEPRADGIPWPLAPAAELGSACVPRLTSPDGTCFASFISAAEETRPWVLQDQQPDSATAGQQLTLTWSNAQTPLFGLYGWGPLDGYGTSGYVVDLPANAMQAQALTSFLLSAGWLDRSTRVVSLQANLYNPGTVSLSVVRLVWERKASSMGITSFEIMTFPLRVSDETLQGVSIAAEVLYTIITAHGLFSLARQLVQRRGAFFSSLFNIGEVIFQAANLGLITLWWSTLSAPQLRTFSTATPVFLDMYDPARAYRLTVTWAGLTVFLCGLKFFRFLNLDAHFNVLWQALASALPEIAALTFALMLIVVSFAFLGEMLFGAISPAFHTLESSVSTLLQMTTGSFDYQSMSQARAELAGPFFGVYMIATYVLGVNVVVAICTLWYSKYHAYLQAADKYKLAVTGPVSFFCTRARLMLQHPRIFPHWLRLTCCGPTSCCGPEGRFACCVRRRGTPQATRLRIRDGATPGDGSVRGRARSSSMGAVGLSAHSRAGTLAGDAAADTAVPVGGAPAEGAAAAGQSAGMGGAQPPARSAAADPAMAQLELWQRERELEVALVRCYRQGRREAGIDLHDYLHEQSQRLRGWDTQFMSVHELCTLTSAKPCSPGSHVSCNAARLQEAYFACKSTLLLGGISGAHRHVPSASYGNVDGKPRFRHFEVVKVNVRGAGQKRVLLIDPELAVLVNFDTRFRLLKKLPLVQLLQADLCAADPTRLTLVFTSGGEHVTDMDHEAALDELLETVYTILFPSHEERGEFVTHLLRAHSALPYVLNSMRVPDEILEAAAAAPNKSSGPVVDAFHAARETMKTSASPTAAASAAGGSAGGAGAPAETADRPKRRLSRLAGTALGFMGRTSAEKAPEAPSAAAHSFSMPSSLRSSGASAGAGGSEGGRGAGEIELTPRGSLATGAAPGTAPASPSAAHGAPAGAPSGGSASLAGWKQLSWRALRSPGMLGRGTSKAPVEEPPAPQPVRPVTQLRAMLRSLSSDGGAAKRKTSDSARLTHLDGADWVTRNPAAGKTIGAAAALDGSGASSSGSGGGGEAGGSSSGGGSGSSTTVVNPLAAARAGSPAEAASSAAAADAAAGSVDTSESAKHRGAGVLLSTVAGAKLRARSASHAAGAAAVAEDSDARQRSIIQALVADGKVQAPKPLPGTSTPRFSATPRSAAGGRSDGAVEAPEPPTLKRRIRRGSPASRVLDAARDWHARELQLQTTAANLQQILTLLQQQQAQLLQRQAEHMLRLPDAGSEDPHGGETSSERGDGAFATPGGGSGGGSRGGGGPGNLYMSMASRVSAHKLALEPVAVGGASVGGISAGTAIMRSSRTMLGALGGSGRRLMLPTVDESTRSSLEWREEDAGGLAAPIGGAAGAPGLASCSGGGSSRSLGLIPPRPPASHAASSAGRGAGGAPAAAGSVTGPSSDVWDGETTDEVSVSAAEGSVGEAVVAPLPAALGGPIASPLPPRHGATPRTASPAAGVAGGSIEGMFSALLAEMQQQRQTIATLQAQVAFLHPPGGAPGSRS